MPRAPLLFAAGLVPALAAGWLAFPRLLYRRVPQPVSFSHAVHADKASTSCADCHALGEDGRFSGVPKLEKCASCHAQAIGGSAEEKRFVAEFVEKSREPEWLVSARQPDNVHFPHAAHVAAAKLACDACHGPHGASDRPAEFAANRISGESRGVWGPRIARLGLRPGEGMKMTDCVSCHEAKGRALSCVACHR